jgi:hypothetical protein
VLLDGGDLRVTAPRQKRPRMPTRARLMLLAHCASAVPHGPRDPSLRRVPMQTACRGRARGASEFHPARQWALAGVEQARSPGYSAPRSGNERLVAPLEHSVVGRPQQARRGPSLGRSHLGERGRVAPCSPRKGGPIRADTRRAGQHQSRHGARQRVCCSSIWAECRRHVIRSSPPRRRLGRYVRSCRRRSRFGSHAEARSRRRDELSTRGSLSASRRFPWA